MSTGRPLASHLVQQGADARRPCSLVWLEQINHHGGVSFCRPPKKKRTLFSALIPYLISDSQAQACWDACLCVPGV